jgi:hypothetical protein
LPRVTESNLAITDELPLNRGGEIAYHPQGFREGANDILYMQLLVVSAEVSTEGRTAKERKFACNLMPGSSTLGATALRLR